MIPVIIRTENASDMAAIRAVHVAAFANHPFSRQTEHLIVDALRQAGALDISLVAEVDGRVVGHIAFSKAPIGGMDCGWFLLGPVGVLPTCQRGGIGSALVKSGLAQIRPLGARGCALVGDPHFYARFGFASRADITMPGVPQENVMALAFETPLPAGPLGHHEAFFANT